MLSLTKFGWLLFWGGALLFVAAIVAVPFMVFIGVFAESPRMQSGVNEAVSALMVLFLAMPIVTALGIAIVFISHGRNWWRRTKIKTVQNTDWMSREQKGTPRNSKGISEDGKGQYPAADI